MWMQTELIIMMMAAPVLGTVVAGAAAVITVTMDISKSK